MKAKRSADAAGPSGPQKRAREDIFTQITKHWPASTNRTLPPDPKVDALSSSQQKEGIQCRAYIISATKGKVPREWNVQLALSLSHGQVTITNPRGYQISAEFRASGIIPAKERTKLVHYHATKLPEDGIEVEIPFFDVKKDPETGWRNNIYSPVSYGGAWTTRVTIPSGAIFTAKHFGSLDAGFAGLAQVTLVPQCRMLNRRKASAQPQPQPGTSRRRASEDRGESQHPDIDLDDAAGGEGHAPRPDGGPTPYTSFLVSNITPLTPKVAWEALPAARIASLLAGIAAAGVAGCTVPEAPFLKELWGQYAITVGGARPVERSGLVEFIRAFGPGTGVGDPLDQPVLTALTALEAGLAQLTKTAPEAHRDLALETLERMVLDEVAGQGVEANLLREVRLAPIQDEERPYYPIANNLITAAVISDGAGGRAVQRRRSYFVFHPPEEWSELQLLTQLGLPSEPALLTTFGSLLEKVSLVVVGKLDEGSRSIAESLNPEDYPGGAIQLKPTQYFLDILYPGFLDWAVPVGVEEFGGLVKRPAALGEPKRLPASSQHLTKAKEWFSSAAHTTGKNLNADPATTLQDLVEGNQCAIVNGFPPELVVQELKRRPISRCAIYVPHRILLDRVPEEHRHLVRSLADFLAYGKDPDDYLATFEEEATRKLKPGTAFQTVTGALELLQDAEEPQTKPLVFIYSQAADPKAWLPFNEHLLAICQAAIPETLERLANPPGDPATNEAGSELGGGADQGLGSGAEDEVATDHE